MGVWQDLKTLRHLLFTRARGGTHAERLDAFYRAQADGYDDFRKRLLCGREALVQALPLAPGRVWVDLGGGTGANLAMAGERLAALQRVYLVDLCPSLVQVARRRVGKACWKNVDVLEGDATTFALPEGVQADVVTFSYALTMIPDWFLALEQALRLLRPGGTLGVVDFYVARKHPAPGRARHTGLRRNFWPLWFANDNVWLSPDHLPWLEAHCHTVQVQEHLGKVPYFPAYHVPYYVYLGQKR